jgi:hypothetical protein
MDCTEMQLPEFLSAVAGVRFQLMSFEVGRKFSRTFNHTVDHCLAIKLG